MASRQPDFVIGEPERPYMRRWCVIPRNRWFNVYLHEILRSDDDRALHDHPWLNASYVVAGSYIEHVIAAGGVHRRLLRAAGSLTLRRSVAAHRLEVRQPAISLFITGPRLRSWGFHCPDAGWVHWRDFTAGPNGETVGRGCGEHPIQTQPSSATPSGAEATAGGVSPHSVPSGDAHRGGHS